MTTQRMRAFESLYKEVESVLTHYTETHPGTGWSREAAMYSQIMSQSIRESGSLITLHTSIMEFAKGLRHTGNYMASFLFSEETLAAYGSGSTLKKSLEEVLGRYDPYKFNYIVDEVSYGQIYGPRNEPFTPAIMRCFKPGYLQYLSEDSKKILHEALEDEALKERLKEQAYQCRRTVLFEALLKEIQPAKPKLKFC